MEREVNYTLLFLKLNQFISFPGVNTIPSIALASLLQQLLLCYIQHVHCKLVSILLQLPLYEHMIVQSSTGYVKNNPAQIIQIRYFQLVGMWGHVLPEYECIGEIINDQIQIAFFLEQMLDRLRIKLPIFVLISFVHGEETILAVHVLTLQNLQVF